jgi:hypothetical protein
MDKRSTLAVLPVLLLLGALDGSANAPEDPQAARSAANSPILTEGEALGLEAQLAGSTDQMEARSTLLRYYFTLGGREARSRRLPHALWIISNAPESENAGSPFAGLDPHLEPEAYDLGRQSWLKLVTERPGQPRILRNAARFFMRGDPAIATDILARGARLEPSEPWWSLRLAELDWRAARAERSENRSTMAARAAGRYDEVLGGTGRDADAVSDFDLARAAEAALAAGQDEAARRHATRLLDRVEASPNKGEHGYAIHEGNRILGQLALRSGDVEAAKSRLILAGRTPGSPALNTFGPSLDLANLLLVRGEQNAVIEYLQSCSRFWKPGTAAIEAWVQEIRSGKVPDLNRFRARKTS